MSAQRKTFGFLLLLSLLAPPLDAAPPIPGKRYTCDFGPYGKVVIDTRYPGASITIGGKVHPAQDGSYFYQSRDGDIAVMFGPNMRFWEYRGVRDDHCIVHQNRRDDAPR